MQFFVLDKMFAFIQGFTPDSVAATPDIASYVEAILSLYLAFGLAFQVPIVVMLLVRFGLVDIAKLKSFRGYFIVVAFIIAAVVTPPDVISQLALAVPMCILYEIGILGAGWFSRVSKAPEEEAEPGTAVDKPAEDKPSPESLRAFPRGDDTLGAGGAAGPGPSSVSLALGRASFKGLR